NGTYVTFTLSRGGDGTVRSSDRSYPIKVKLSLNGQTDYDDYILSYSCNEGTTWSNATPSAGSVEISIPTNTDSIKFRVHANDDLTVERSFETLNISINEAKNGFAEYSYIEYPFVFVERKLQVQDVGTLTLEDVQFINNEALKSDNAAASESWQNELHWKKDHLEQTRPIAYVSDKKLKTTAHFSGNIDSSITSLKIRYRVIGIGSGGCRPHKLLTFQTAQIVSL
ncbi:MAG: hypothetical protein J6X44_12620, partial [Thermoguttaceae bacterium]|nr:hypothetical protein [Thermoguttaceae bacterium]